MKSSFLQCVMIVFLAVQVASAQSWKPPARSPSWTPPVRSPSWAPPPRSPSWVPPPRSPSWAPPPRGTFYSPVEVVGPPPSEEEIEAAAKALQEAEVHVHELLGR